MSTEPRRASEAELAKVAEIAEPFGDCLMSMGQDGLHVLCYIAAKMMMEGQTSVPKVEAWDHVSASIRRTIEHNVKASLS